MARRTIVSFLVTPLLGVLMAGCGGQHKADARVAGVVEVCGAPLLGERYACIRQSGSVAVFGPGAADRAGATQPWSVLLQAAAWYVRSGREDPLQRAVHVQARSQGTVREDHNRQFRARGQLSDAPNAMPLGCRRTAPAFRLFRHEKRELAREDETLLQMEEADVRPEARVGAACTLMCDGRARVLPICTPSTFAQRGSRLPASVIKQLD